MRRHWLIAAVAVVVALVVTLIVVWIVHSDDEDLPPGVAAIVPPALPASQLVPQVSTVVDAVSADVAAAEMATWVNKEREWNGVDPLLVDPGLEAQAELQASRMATVGGISHSPSAELGWWLQQGWTSIGENVAVANGRDLGAVWAAHQGLMRSPDHLANILAGQYRGVGVGVVVDSWGRVWVAQFYGGF